MTLPIERETKFLDLVKRVSACTTCPRMNGSARVLGPGCGPLDAPLLFVGEAPGRLGADGSHLPFHGDKSGHNFERLISQVEISRYDVFVTNAVLCNPKDEQGNNATPTPVEISNCAPFMRETIEILEPSIVVTLGAVALKACNLIEPHKLILKEHVRTTNRWLSRALIPVYHPGQRAMLHRSFANQLSDYQFISETLRRLKKPIQKRKTNSARTKPSKIGAVASRVLQKKSGVLSYFALHKLCFLAEVAALEATGKRITQAYVVRQKDGPYFVDLHASKLAELIPGIAFRTINTKLSLSITRQIELLADTGFADELQATDLKCVDDVMNKYGDLDDKDLKRIVYLNKYMRALLRKEKSSGANLYNAAVLPYTPRIDLD
jgi:uracil-DNA glycosylase family 4